MLGCMRVSAVSRRALLQLPGLQYFAHAAQLSGWDARMVRYLESLARPDGAYGYEEQPESHITATWAVVGSYAMLKLAPPRRLRTAEQARKRAATRSTGRSRTWAMQQIQTLQWLGEPAGALKEEVAQWIRPVIRRRTETHPPLIQLEAASLISRKLLGLPMQDVSPASIEFFEARRRPNGSFNNTLAVDKSDGHIYATWCGLSALQALGRTDEHGPETAAWLRDCQLPNGAFTYAPRASIGAVDDMRYTWAGVHALALCSTAPGDAAAVVKYILSLWNEDGGFGDRPGMGSRPESTYFALSTLSALNNLPALNNAMPRPRRVSARLPAGLKVFCMQMGAPGKGSPQEAVSVAQSLKIHLWGARDADAKWLERAQTLAGERGVPVNFFAESDEYEVPIALPGIGSYARVSEVYGTQQPLTSKSQGVKETLWSEYRDRRVAALRKTGGGAVFWVSENDDYNRILIDDSLERNGFTAIGGYHFLNGNMTYEHPMLLRYRNAISFVALQDARSKESWWWADELTGTRTLFLASEPTWDGWQEALRRRWVFAARHDASTSFGTRILGPEGSAMSFLREREAEWKWWREDPKDLRRPLAILSVLTPDEGFEEQRPTEGVGVRVRLWWTYAGGRLGKQMAELTGFAIDGGEISPRIYEVKDNRGALLDHYYYVSLLDPSPGKHQVTARVRNLADKRVDQYTIPFTVRAKGK